MITAFIGLLCALDILVSSAVGSSLCRMVRHLILSVHLARGDVVINSGLCPAGISVNIKSSKTDPFRQGVTLYLGQAGVDLWPVAAMINYLAVRGIDSGPLFQFQDGSPLHRQQLVLASHSQCFGKSEF